MTTFAEDILRVAGDEPIIGIVIGQMGWGGYEEGYKAEGKPPWSSVAERVIAWRDAEPLLNYEYDAGYGAPECQAITAWTDSLVIFVTQYDGSTRVHSLPRNPMPHSPIMPGG